jgi:hypothetical protein
VKSGPQNLLAGVLPAAAAVFGLSQYTVAGPINLSKPTLVVAQVETVDCHDRSFQALGLKFQSADEYVLAGICDPSADESLRYASISAVVAQDGSLVATSVASLGARYIPGVSPVYIVGEVSASRVDVGAFAIAGSAPISIVTSSPRLGERVEVIGTQPQVGGVIIAASVHASDLVSLVEGQGNATVDSGALNCAIIGSGIQSNAIIGSGVSKNAIIGSGIQSNAIIGSGASTNAIIGSGIQSKAIIGSGASTTAIIGSGIQSKAIIGSGASTNAIIGSGVQTSAIAGSGVSTSAIIGSGLQSNAIIGSGASTNAIIGSGAQLY